MNIHLIGYGRDVDGACVWVMLFSPIRESFNMGAVDSHQVSDSISGSIGWNVFPTLVGKIV